jgi:hypothetical protein
MSAQGAAATGASDETTPQQTETTQEEQQQQQEQKQQEQEPKSFREEVLAGLELPAEVLEAVRPKAQGAQPGGPAGEEQQQQQEQEEGQGEGEEGEEEEEGPIAAQAREKPIPEEWPESAKRRVAQEVHKRRERTGERDALWQQNQQLSAAVQQLQAQAEIQRPTEKDPLADVMNFPALQQVKTLNENLEDFCDRNPDGADNVLTGYDPQGNEVRRDYSVEEIRDMKAFAKQQLRQVPVRAVYLEDLVQKNAIAQELYPEMYERGTQEAQLAEVILQAIPEIQRRSDFPLWLGAAIDGFKGQGSRVNSERQSANGKPLSPEAQAIFNQPKLRAAPGVAKRVGPEIGSRGAERGGAEVKRAREEFEQGGFSDEGLEKLVAAKLERKIGRGGQQRTLA